MERNSTVFLAELFGTFVLVLGGCGAVIFGGPTLSILTIATAFGLSVTAMAYTVGPVSGCHLNPAVTFAMVMAKKLDPSKMPAYLVAQFLGAALGGAVLVLMCFYHAQGLNLEELAHTGFATNGYGAHSPGQYGLVSCFITEVVLTAVFVWVVLGTTRRDFPEGMGGLVAGLTLLVIHLVGTQITGTSVNPARSFGVAIYKGGAALEQLWLFIVAPLVGSILSAFLFKLISKE